MAESLMKHKVSELEGPLLDAAVAKAEGLRVVISDTYGLEFHAPDGHLVEKEWSTQWADGGPIIERERIATVMLNGQWCAWTPCTELSDYVPSHWLFEKTAASADGRGPTALIAAMRAYVASKFGDEVDLSIA